MDSLELKARFEKKYGWYTNAIEKIDEFTLVIQSLLIKWCKINLPVTLALF